jgi:signal transduction histidine kinase
MKSFDINYFNIGSRLTLIFMILIAIILGGNALLIWQFRLARLQTDRLTDVSQQMIEILRLQESLLAFHHRLEELTQSRDAHRLVTEAEPLHRALLEQIQRTRNASHLEAGVAPTFLTTLEAIQFTLTSQLAAVTAIAMSGDWEAVRLRLANEMRPLETQTSALVNSVDQDVSEELTQAVANMTNLQLRILVIVPMTAISTFFIAAFFGRAITKRITELRFEERVGERTRIAGEMHDTLLQGCISTAMQLHVANRHLPADLEAKPLVGEILEQLEKVIEEGRNALRGLRSTIGSSRSLEKAFSEIGEELGNYGQVEYRVLVHGRPISLRPAIRDEVYLIGREALANAFRHAQASAVEVELLYQTNQLRMLIRDNGHGIDPEVLREGREGHWGLCGMRERAKRIGGKLRVLSGEETGTEIELMIPAQVAFEEESHQGLR